MTNIEHLSYPQKLEALGSRAPFVSSSEIQAFVEDCADCWIEHTGGVAKPEWAALRLLVHFDRDKLVTQLNGARSFPTSRTNSVYVAHQTAITAQGQHPLYPPQEDVRTMTRATEQEVAAAKSAGYPPVAPVAPPVAPSWNTPVDLTMTAPPSPPPSSPAPVNLPRLAEPSVIPTGQLPDHAVDSRPVPSRGPRTTAAATTTVVDEYRDLAIKEGQPYLTITRKVGGTKRIVHVAIAQSPNLHTTIERLEAANADSPGKGERIARRYFNLGVKGEQHQIGSNLLGKLAGGKFALSCAEVIDEIHKWLPHDDEPVAISASRQLSREHETRNKQLLELLGQGLLTLEQASVAAQQAGFELQRRAAQVTVNPSDDTPQGKGDTNGDE